MGKWIGPLVASLVLLFTGSLTEAQAGPGLLPTLAQESSSEVDPDSLHPNPKLSPAEVIRIQIEALGHNDVPHKNAGIEITFRFASPGNKMATGPLDHFIQLVSGPVYRPMLNHQEARYGEIRMKGNEARQPVILTTKNGERVGYVFSLSKQEGGPHNNCWMTDSVVPVAAPYKPEEPLPTI
jgi:hypothetical protein